MPYLFSVDGGSFINTSLFGFKMRPDSIIFSVSVLLIISYKMDLSKNTFWLVILLAVAETENASLSVIICFFSMQMDFARGLNFSRDSFSVGRFGIFMFFGDLFSSIHFFMEINI